MELNLEIELDELKKRFSYYKDSNGALSKTLDNIDFWKDVY